MLELDDCETTPRYRRTTAVSVGGLWLTIFCAGVAAVLVGGLILGIGVRAYLHWSVKDTADKIGTKWNEKK